MIERPLYLDKIMSFVDSPFVKIITGVRRCGKTTILKMIMSKLKTERHIPDSRIISYRFDSMEYSDMTASQMYKELKSRLSSDYELKTYLFLDEVQEIEGWEKVVNSLASDFNTDIYVTGSNSKMMSSEISTYLTGRYISFRVYTLSFSEYLLFKSKYKNVGSPHIELINYIKEGGFPAVHLHDYDIDESYTAVRDIYNSTIFSDIVSHSQIRRVDQLERIVNYTFNNIGKTFSANSIADYIKSKKHSIDIETIYSYLEKLEQAYILYRCSRFDLRGKEILKTQEKFYVADTSLRYSVMGYNSDSVRAALENAVYLELCRRGYFVYIGKIDSGEIDFVAGKQNKRMYIQVAKEINSEKTESHEYEKLLEIHDNYPKYVLSTNNFYGGNYKGIKSMHIADFLISDEY